MLFGHFAPMVHMHIEPWVVVVLAMLAGLMGAHAWKR